MNQYEYLNKAALSLYLANIIDKNEYKNINSKIQEHINKNKGQLKSVGLCLNKELCRKIKRSVNKKEE